MADWSSLNGALDGLLKNESSSSSSQQSSSVFGGSSGGSGEVAGLLVDNFREKLEQMPEKAQENDTDIAATVYKVFGDWHITDPELGSDLSPAFPSAPNNTQQPILVRTRDDLSPEFPEYDIEDFYPYPRGSVSLVAERKAIAVVGEDRRGLIVKAVERTDEAEEMEDSEVQVYEQKRDEIMSNDDLSWQEKMQAVLDAYEPITATSTARL